MPFATSGLARGSAALAFMTLLVVAGSTPAAGQSAALEVVPPAQQMDQAESLIGVKAGFVAPGCVYIDDSDCFDSEISYSLGAFLDYPLAERLFGGLSVDIHGASVEFSDDTETLVDLALTLKANISEPDATTKFRPGFAIGYGFVDLQGENSKHLTIRGLVDVVLVTESGRSWVVEGAIYASPAGGTEDFDATFGPGGMLRAGIIF